MKLIISDHVVTRKEAKEHPENLYIFADNTDRTSGRNLIPDDRFYSKKYGRMKYYPNITSAQIRGLDNSLPISTQRWYHGDKKGENGRWHDCDFFEFSKIVWDEYWDIIHYINTNKPENVILPPGGLVNSPISAITLIRTPKLYNEIGIVISRINIAVQGVVGVAKP